jgi:transcriptional regulator with XRE-family HTH domain
MLVKELAALSGVKKKTIDSYLGINGYTPSVYTAINIAKALGVSVEYLVTGKEVEKDRPLSSLPKDIQKIALTSEQLKVKDRQIVLSLAQSLKNR